MTTAQKIIKYIAVAFAFLLIFTIISSIAAGFELIGNAFAPSKNNVKENIEEIWKSTSSDISLLDVDLKFSKLNIKKGDTFKAVSNSKYISVTQDENKIKIKDNKKFTLGSSLESEVTLYIPDEFILDTANIESGAGSMYIESLYAYKLNLNLGAGKVIIDHIYSEKTYIDAGAGKFEIKSGALQNLDFDMGVGETTINASITGKSEIDAGVGNLNINLFGDEDKYQIEFSKGIGNIKLGDRDISDGEIVGNGLETIKIDGGIGSIKVNFVNE